jgi:uncharacterized protein YceK
MIKKESRFLSFTPLLILTIVCLLSGCTSVLCGRYGDYGQTKAEFTQYVETVFKMQNSMTSEMMAITDANADLVQADQKMQEVCAPLNEYAVREVDKLNIAISLLRRVEKAVVACEKAAQKVQTLLAHQ